MDFSGIKVLEEVASPVNGKIRVVKSLGFGTYIQVEGLTQSGGVVYEIWEETLKKVSESLATNHQTLILGLGGGTAAKLVRKFWPKAKVTGVDIDPVMVELGIRYLGLGDSKTKIIIGDAFNYTLSAVRYRHNRPSFAYDLVIVDLYIGDEFPKKFESERFSRLVHGLIAKNGVAVFNRLYYGEKRKEAVKFGNKLEKIFSKVEWFYPQANLMFFCRK